MQAISLRSSVEVLVARMAPSLHTASSLPKISFLRSMSSNTASTTRSASAKSAKSRVPAMVERIRFPSSGLRRPLAPEES